MARVFDIIEVPNMGADELVRRFPEQGSGDFRIGSQLIVGPGQEAVFVRDGKALDTFGPGRHTITTANIPLLVNLIGKVFGGRTPFTAEAYFVNTRVFPDMGWGTANPIPVMHPGVGLGASLLKAYGTFKMKVSNSQMFINEVVGRRGSYRKEDIQDWLRTAVLTQFRDAVGTLNKSAFEIQGLTADISELMLTKTQDDFEAMGLVLVDFKVAEITPSAKTAQELRDMGLLNVQIYTQLQAADAIRDAANAPGGNLAGAGVGLGAGVSLGQMMGQVVQGGMQPPQQQPATAGAAAGAAAAATVACASCGQQNPAGAKFCSNCGEKMPEARQAVLLSVRSRVGRGRQVLHQLWGKAGVGQAENSPMAQRVKFEHKRARSGPGLALLVVCTLLALALTAREDERALAFASPQSPVAPESDQARSLALPVVNSPRTGPGWLASVWRVRVGIGLVVLGLALVIGSLVWIASSGMPTAPRPPGETGGRAL